MGFLDLPVIQEYVMSAVELHMATSEKRIIPATSMSKPITPSTVEYSTRSETTVDSIAKKYTDSGPRVLLSMRAYQKYYSDSWRIVPCRINQRVEIWKLGSEIIVECEEEPTFLKKCNWRWDVTCSGGERSTTRRACWSILVETRGRTERGSL